MAHTQEQALPVLHPVTDYEKIKRVGEGTYGVVCKSSVVSYRLKCAFPVLLHISLTMLHQTKQGTGKQARLLH